MIQFRKYKLRELGSMKNGANYPKGSYGKGIKIVNVKDLFKGRFVPDNELDELKENILKDDSIYTVEHGDILFTRSSLVRSGAGMCAMINNPNQKILFCGFIIRFRIFEKNRFYPLYLLYMLRSPAYRALFTGSQQTCITNINQDTLGDIEVYIPIDENGDIDFNKQVELVNSLNSIDDKIALNNKTNSELESMAKTVYDYWFTQFDFPDANGNPYKTSGGKMEYNQVLKREIPAGWEVGRLDSICETVLGGTPSTDNEEYWNGTIPWLNSGEVAEFPIITAEKTVTELGIRESATELLPSGSVTLSITRHLRPSILTMDACINQSVVGLKENNTFNKYFIYPFIESKIDHYMKLRTGAQQPHINKETVDETILCFPTDEILQQYYKTVGNLYERIIANAKENKELTKLRDYLLPLLMNGQIEVK